MTSGFSYDNAPKSRLNGDDLRSMFSVATELLESNVEEINALNVFPVPDGDTGTNMFLTMRSVVDAADQLPGAPAGEVASAIARGALMGARGNSGVILSQLFSGLSSGLEGVYNFGAKELAGAFQEAREQAYKAVGEPVEGTMLTVISSAAEAAQGASAGGGSVQDVCEAVCSAAIESVAKTPTLLPVLRDAGVVDAGGQGVAVILEGVRRYVTGEVSGPLKIAPPEPVGIAEHSGQVSQEFLASTDEELYGYCTQFLVEGQRLDVDAIRDTMSALARSTVVVGDEAIVNVHVHTEDPGPIVSVGVSHGMLSQVKIQNMDAQHAEYSAARRQDSTVESEAESVAVVAVASGKGLEAVFTNLGASEIVRGGDTMNPSVRDLMRAIDRAPSDKVVVLPNNGNIVPAAVQAAESSSKTARVVATRTIPQGIAAILAFNLDRDLESNLGEMEAATGSIQTGEVTEAVRPATVNGVTVEPRQLIGLLEHELVAAGNDLSRVVVSTIKAAKPPGGGMVTLYWGERLTQDEANGVMHEVAVAFPEEEVELVEGGQPHYHLIFSVE